MKIGTITGFLESRAPLSLQEDYDNAGLITGDAEAPCTGAVICLDALEEVVDEAIELGYNLIIAHHPILFTGLRSLTGATYVERVLIKAIRHNIAIYAIHTNLDNVIDGVNARMADKLGLKGREVLSPKKGILRKLYTFAPAGDADKVRKALFGAGAGHIGDYDSCSFSAAGTGTFRGGVHSNPYAGSPGKLHQEQEEKIEVLFPEHLERKVTSALIEAHPYEEVAYDILKLENMHPGAGSGLLGTLPEPVGTMELLKRLRETFRAEGIRHTAPHADNISRVALCGGSGSFLLPAAIRCGADMFITADLKYHQFFDADGRIVIADIGHYESEQFTSELIYDMLSQKFGNFALHLTKINTNPINYL